MSKWKMEVKESGIVIKKKEKGKVRGFYLDGVHVDKFNKYKLSAVSIRRVLQALNGEL